MPGEEVYPAEWPTQTVQNFTPPRNNLEALEQAARGLAPAAGPRGGLFQRRREMVRMVDLPPPPVRGGFGGQAGFNEEPRRLDRDRDVIMGNGPELEPIVRARDRTEARRNAVLDGRRRVEERIARWDPPRVLEDTGLLRFGETQQEERERIRLEELDRARQRAENVAWNIELAMAHQRELDRGVQQGERERARRRERDRAQQRDLDLTMQMLERETGQQLLARADARFATVMAERRGGDARHGRAHRGYQHQPEFRRPR